MDVFSYILLSVLCILTLCFVIKYILKKNEIEADWDDKYIESLNKIYKENDGEAN